MFNMHRLMGLDFETYGAVSLPDHGLERYVADKSFTPLIACTASFSEGGGLLVTRFDFTDPATFYTEVTRLRSWLSGRIVCAHNAGFEQRVLQWLGIELPTENIVDTAVVARAAGAGGKLEAAAPQLLGTDKLEDGWRLIKLFSIPSKEQLERGERYFDTGLKSEHVEDWETFNVYCELDAKLSLKLAWEIGFQLGLIGSDELRYQAVTMEMNQRGWHVDVACVEEMQRRYLENVEAAVEEFRITHDAEDLNLNSLPQLKAWCLERGIKANSFDEKNVAKLHSRISKRLAACDDGSKPLAFEKYHQYCEVLSLLETKQILGGSSLKKLQVILDTVSEDDRLRDQYLHVGAGQTWRTTGRSVQMQNLKRLSTVADMGELDDPDSEWDNEQLAANLRQVFTATDPNGALIVGDFSSIESRGLAWLACAWWKCEAYRQGKDMYKVLAAEMFGVHYDDVTKEQRQAGKVGELSCGYNAGGEAVRAFAEGMGIELNEAEAAKLVFDWRASNPEVVNLWGRLDECLLEGFKRGEFRTPVGYDYMVVIRHWPTPESLLAQHPKAQSLVLELRDSEGKTMLRRIFHGCYERGRGLCYYKPSQLKNGDLWSNHFTDPKTKQVRFYNIYGGKLAGILTQSFCRELFFRALVKVHSYCRNTEGLDLIGQFHDEIVLDWRPGGDLDLAVAESVLERFMSSTTIKGFPMAAEIKHDYRYTK